MATHGGRHSGGGNDFGSYTPALLSSAAVGQGDKLEEPDHSSSLWYFTREEIDCNSPSRKDGIDLKRETYLRRSYCTFLQDLGMRLKVPQITIATAIIFCHRFFLRQSHHKNDRFMIATVCMFLAAKVEETPRRLEEVIIISLEVQKKRDPEALARIRQKDKYEEAKEQVLVGERLLLTTLGFDLNVSHPYKPLVAAIKKLGIAQQALAQVAWNFVNDGLRTSLCLQLKPHHIAAGAIFLAAKFLKVRLPTEGGGAWFHDFDVEVRQLEEVSNQMLELYEQNKSASATAAASRGSAPNSTAGGPSTGKQRKGAASAPPANGQVPAQSQPGAPREQHEAGSSRSSAKEESQLTREGPQDPSLVRKPSPSPAGAGARAGAVEKRRPGPCPNPQATTGAMASPQAAGAEERNSDGGARGMRERAEASSGKAELEDDAMSLDSAEGHRSPRGEEEPGPAAQGRGLAEEPRPLPAPQRTAAAAAGQHEAEAQPPAKAPEEDEEQRRTWDLLEDVEMGGGRAKERTGKLKLRKPLGDLLPPKVRESLAKIVKAEASDAAPPAAEPPAAPPPALAASASAGSGEDEGAGGGRGDKGKLGGPTEDTLSLAKEKGSQAGEPASKGETAKGGVEEGELPVKRKRDSSAGSESDESVGEGKRMRSGAEPGELDRTQPSQEAGEAEPIEDGELPERSESPALREADRAHSSERGPSDRGGKGEGTSRRGAQFSGRAGADGAGPGYGPEGRQGYRSRDSYSHGYSYPSRDRDRYREPYREKGDKDSDRDRERHKHRDDASEWPSRKTKFHS